MRISHFAPTPPPRLSANKRAKPLIEEWGEAHSINSYRGSSVTHESAARMVVCTLSLHEKVVHFHA